MSALDWLVLAALAAAAVLALRFLRRHPGGCGGTCSGCPHADACRERKKK